MKLSRRRLLQLIPFAPLAAKALAGIKLPAPQPSGTDPKPICRPIGPGPRWIWTTIEPQVEVVRDHNGIEVAWIWSSELLRGECFAHNPIQFGETVSHNLRSYQVLQSINTLVTNKDFPHGHIYCVRLLAKRWFSAREDGPFKLSDFSKSSV